MSFCADDIKHLSGSGGQITTTAHGMRILKFAVTLERPEGITPRAAARTLGTNLLSHINFLHAF